ncbi:hypothetical protein OZ668_05140 [Elizabethkingia sp. HX XZB]|uniref:hypothetical protein n=1 Tax=Elizabethkingia sp. HX XZB TaxID=3003193 RepID=UPI002A2420AF|nr:hypothetical protein [Elizabethkingia sp. HX XZB]MDX8567356.1 hypothetical protein [Elizabethkingia sp. HX XZB]
MKANVQYDDLIGTSAADISDYISTTYGGDNLESIANYFKLDKNKFRLIGISFYGTEDFGISLLCVDIEKSTSQKEHIVSMMINWKQDENPLSVLFKRMNIVFHENHDEKYSSLDYDEEINYNDVHNNDD